MKKELLIWLLTVISALHAYPQSRTVTGKVTDNKDGSPLPGVTVQVKGTNKGVYTSPDGTYRINDIDQANTLVFSFIGFLSQERQVGANGTIRVGLGADKKQI